MPNRALNGQKDRVGKEGVRVEETTQMLRIEEPRRGKCSGRLMRMGGSKCSLFGLEPCNTVMKSTRLQCQPSATSSSTPASAGGRSRGPRRRSRLSLVGSFHTSIPVISSLALPLNRLWDTQNASNTLPEPRSSCIHLNSPT